MNALICGACGAVGTTSMPIEAKTASYVERDGELRVPVPDQVREPVPGLLEFGRELPGGLDGPRAGRMRGDAEQLNPAGSQFDHEHWVQARERQRVGVGEVDREE